MTDRERKARIEHLTREDSLIDMLDDFDGMLPEPRAYMPAQPVPLFDGKPVLTDTIPF